MDDTITIEAVGDEHTDPLPVAAALSASIPTHTGTRARPLWDKRTGRTGPAWPTYLLTCSGRSPPRAPPARGTAAMGRSEDA